MTQIIFPIKHVHKKHTPSPPWSINSFNVSLATRNHFFGVVRKKPAFSRLFSVTISSNPYAWIMSRLYWFNTAGFSPPLISDCSAIKRITFSNTSPRAISCSMTGWLLSVSKPDKKLCCTSRLSKKSSLLTSGFTISAMVINVVKDCFSARRCGILATNSFISATSLALKRSCNERENSMKSINHSNQSTIRTFFTWITSLSYTHFRTQKLCLCTENRSNRAEIFIPNFRE